MSTLIGSRRAHIGLASLVAIAIAAIVGGGGAGCSKGAAQRAEPSPQTLVGAGATLPYPLYTKWADEYARIEPSVRINYQSAGSGAGIRQVGGGVVDFGATDDPAIAEALRASATKLVRIPMTIGAVVFAYNLPGDGPLYLTGELAAEIFMGKITRWDDARVRAINGARPLPDEPIVVVHRADGSGTSAALTSYLSRHSEAWRSVVGSGASPKFPVGVGARGNEGVTALLKSTPLSIGYVELGYAKQAGLAMAHVRNPAGRFVVPSLDALEHAARAFRARDLDDQAASLIDVEDDDAYPIAAASFIVVPEDSRDRSRALPLARFLWWAVHDGQRFAQSLDYAALPPPLVARAESALRELRAEGKLLLSRVEPSAVDSSALREPAP